MPHSKKRRKTKLSNFIAICPCGKVSNRSGDKVFLLHGRLCDKIPKVWDEACTSIHKGLIPKEMIFRNSTDSRRVWKICKTLHELEMKSRTLFIEYKMDSEVSDTL